MTSLQRPPAGPAAPAYDAPYPADLDRRFYAYAIDRAIGWGLGAAVGALLWWVLDMDDALVVGGAVFGTIVVVSLVFAVLQGTSGATPGKSALGIRSVKETAGRPPGVGGALLRAVILGLAGLPTAGIGVATLAWTAAMDSDGRRRGWHDLVTGTLVGDVRRRPDSDSDDVVETPRAMVNLTAMRLMPAPEPVRPPTPAPRRTPELATDPALRQLDPARPHQSWPLDESTRQAQQPIPPVPPAPPMPAPVRPAAEQPYAAQSVSPPGPARQVPPPAQQPPATPPAAHRPAPLQEPSAPARPPQQPLRGQQSLAPDHQPTGRRPDVPPPPPGPVQPNVQAPRLPTPPANRPPSSGPAGANPAASAGATAAAPSATPVSRWRVTFDTGESFVVDGLALVGRGPQPRPGEAVRHLVPLRSTDMSLSKTHAQFHVARDGVLVVMDRGSTNGSVIIRKGVSRELTAGRPATLVDGDRVKFGDREMVVARES